MEETPALNKSDGETQISPRLSLINSAGAPSEVVVDSAETADEEGLHLKMGLISIK